MTPIDAVADRTEGPARSARETAALALSLLDLTNLRDDCDASDIAELCARARTPFGDAAAICIWPRFVAQARAILGDGHPVRIATVVNFPGGDGGVGAVAAETRAAVADGTDEIDVVIPYRAFLAGDEGAVTATVSAARAACPAAVLKVILETGALGEPGAIAAASDLAVAAGADVLKTSTGKVEVNATLEAAEVMLRAIRRSTRAVGFKAAGGIGSVGEAARYLRAAEAVMGPGWPTAATFRFGASGLLDDILAVLRGEASAGGSPGY